MSSIRIALFNHRADAELARDRLTEAGIPAEVRDEPTLGRLWFISKAAAGVRLEVPADKGGRATALLLEWNEEAESLHDAIRCPECHSLRVDYPQFTEKSLLPNLVMGLLARLGVVEKDYYCEYCHCMWAKPDAKARPARGHMAPNYFLEGVEQLPVAEQPRLHRAPPKPRRQAA